MYKYNRGEILRISSKNLIAQLWKKAAQIKSEATVLKITPINMNRNNEFLKLLMKLMLLN